MPLFAFTQLFRTQLPSLLSAWIWLWLLVAPTQGGFFPDGVSVSEYEGATEAAVRADAAVPTVSYVRGPDLGGGVGGLVASLR